MVFEIWLYYIPNHKSKLLCLQDITLTERIESKIHMFFCLLNCSAYQFLGPDRVKQIFDSTLFSSIFIFWNKITVSDRICKKFRLFDAKLALFYVFDSIWQGFKIFTCFLKAFLADFFAPHFKMKNYDRAKEFAFRRSESTV